MSISPLCLSGDANNNRVQAELELLPAIGIDFVPVKQFGKAIESCSVAISHPQRCEDFSSQKDYDPSLLFFIK